MDAQPNGELIPQGGGDNIPLTRSPLLVGRRESCDICLPFPTLSGKHCEFTFKEGHWIVLDLDSTNGTSVNDIPISKKILHSGDVIAFGSRQFTLQYTESGRVSNLEEYDEELGEVMGMSLLEKAGLAKPPRHAANPVLTPEFGAADFDDDQPALEAMTPTPIPDASPAEPVATELPAAPQSGQPAAEKATPEVAVRLEVQAPVVGSDSVGDKTKPE